MKTWIRLWVLVIVGVSALMAQTKQTPPTRTIDVEISQSDTTDGTHASLPLPKIELPEYVITGVAAIDLPLFEKQAGEASSPVKPRADRSGMTETTKDQPELTGRKATVIGSTHDLSPLARVSASLGTYFTPAVELWVGQRFEKFDYSVNGDYYRTTGFEKGTDRSRGGIQGEAGLELESSSLYVNGARVGFGMEYASDQYRFYGSPEPTLARTVSHLGARISGMTKSSGPVDGSISLFQKETAITDSTLIASERHSAIRVSSTVPVKGMRMNVGFAYETATVHTIGPGSISNVHAHAALNRLWWNDISLAISLHAFFTGDMTGEKGTSLYPNVAASSRILERHILTLSYEPAVEFQSLSGLTRTHPYLSSQSILKNRNVEVDAAMAIESVWIEWLKSKAALQYQSIRNQPLFEEQPSGGVWMPQYPGTTKIWTFKGEAFANVTPNDYFGMALLLRSTKNSATQQRVPYMPAAEVSTFYAHRFPFGVTLSPHLLIMGNRSGNISNSVLVGSYALLNLRADYSPLPRFTVFVTLENITNTKYEVWGGYRAEPLKAYGGVSYSW